MLEKLADDPHFRGTAIVSFVPGLTFMPARRGDAHRPARRVERYEHGSIAQRVSARLCAVARLRGSRSSTATS